VVTGVVFPLAGHCALQSEKPVDVFLKVIEIAPQRLQNLPRAQPIHELWRASYAAVRTLSLLAADELGIGKLTMGAAAIRTGPLNEHPVYRWAFGELERGRIVLDDTQFAKDLAKTFGELPEEAVRAGARGALALDMCLSCPGDTTHRSFLVEWLAPPCVRFPDGKQWALPEVYRRELVPEIDEAERKLSAERRKAAEDILDVNERWLRFRRSVRGY
jgi:hypothetical protein